VPASAAVLTPSELIDTQLWRYATKKFDATSKIPAETWAALEQSLVLSPSSGQYPGTRARWRTPPTS
jgi:hypothetical protein